MEVYGWCLDDPVNLVDPLGLETTGYGLGGSLSGFGLGVGGGGMYVTDDKGNKGVEFYGDYGASSGWGAGLQGSYQKTNATTIDQLSGKSRKIGININTPGTGISAGGEKIKGDGYTGTTFSIGSKLDPAPVEAYAKQEHSVVRKFHSN